MGDICDADIFSGQCSEIIAERQLAPGLQTPLMSEKGCVNWRQFGLWFPFFVVYVKILYEVLYTEYRLLVLVFTGTRVSRVFCHILYDELSSVSIVTMVHISDATIMSSYKNI